ncbi:uncharacterized protein YecE (DUF72 family) [Paenibacillus phyllosphaerae]|uniref:Uncharacterized protein YecE (DUF72 family) n=1 Tax=Paenibacillus phyllosphaerae TaxID=274593 RepID=A0A7W5AXM5_9BACL|nr:DUF72 domain-containing protein [Paenibacillus phyllosphaerae]MBB3110617.1 uncharacterized protein YecE (DUF72 family) [Paenibacillus phyllosphaerae]
MIEIGLCGWGDHDAIYASPKEKNKLAAYANWFPTVEVDSSFYAVQAPRLAEKWVADTPPNFRFVVKAYQGMTGHTRGGGIRPFESEEAMYAAFLASIEPIRAAGKLSAVLFQYPPWFRCDREHVAQLRAAKARMTDIPCALEFRHQSWYEPAMRERTLDFTRREGWIHTVCDEPQAGEGSVPIVEAVTDAQLSLIRLHGRNVSGWHSSGQPNWRDVRYLYRYNDDELEEWAQRIRRLAEQTERVCVLFNNNSGGDAADNALTLMRMLDVVPPRGSYDLPVKIEPEPVDQLDLFDLPDTW